MKRKPLAATLAVCAAGGLAAAFLLGGTSVAGAQDGTTTVPATTVPPATTTPPPTATTPPPVTTAPAKPKPKPRRPKVIAAGITIGHVLVGGLTTGEATELVRERFRQPLTLVVSPTRKLRVTPEELGASTLLGAAVRRAAVYRQPLNVPLKVQLSERRFDRFVKSLAEDVDREPVDSRLILRHLRPFATRDVPGRKLNPVLLERELTHALRSHDREPIMLPVREIEAEVTQSDFGEVIVIRRSSKQLQLFEGQKLRRTFRIATGQSSYPTPLGSYEIINKWRHPWWYPPEGSAWAANAQPIPPGPGNPLGTRWMGISAPYVGIHGTPDSASIGYSASHGCIRMLIPEVEWLFEQVEVGTPVYIVAA
ncbi:MAG TPA: L,D-transpeptidase family protein [Gaiellaceae bacterium]